MWDSVWQIHIPQPLIQGLTASEQSGFHVTGMDFYVVLDRPGYRVSRRRRAQARVGIQHRLTKDDAMKWCVHINTHLQCPLLAIYRLPWLVHSPAACNCDVKGRSVARLLPGYAACL